MQSKKQGIEHSVCHTHTHTHTISKPAFNLFSKLVTRAFGQSVGGRLIGQ